MQNRTFFYFLILILSLSAHKVKSQNNSFADSTIVNETALADTHALVKNDTVAWVESDSKLAKMTNQTLKNKIAFKPNPKRAVIYSIIFPGLGQIYNRKYWKLPIIYGGFLGLVYAISWNGKYYSDYANAYSGIMSENPFAADQLKKWRPFVSPSVDINALAGSSTMTTLQNSFKRNRDSYRRYRDLSIIGVVALYALCIIDAYVDAELFDFDISPDLSLKVQPTINPANKYSGNNFGVQCSLTF